MALWSATSYWRRWGVRLGLLQPLAKRVLKPAPSTISRMTLILTLVSSNKVVQVSDRRLTLGKDIHDVNANKAICVGCSDARFSVGYTGVAEIDGQRTDYWLVDQISSVFQSGNEDVLTVYKTLQERATKAISHLRYKRRPVHPQGRGLTLVLAGYRTIEAITVPFLAYISNVNPDNSNPLHVESTFSREGWMFDPRALADKQMVFVHGARVTFDAGDSAAGETRRCRVSSYLGALWAVLYLFHVPNLSYLRAEIGRAHV